MQILALEQQDNTSWHEHNWTTEIWNIWNEKSQELEAASGANSKSPDSRTEPLYNC